MFQSLNPRADHAVSGLEWPRVGLSANCPVTGGMPLVVPYGLIWTH